MYRYTASDIEQICSGKIIAGDKTKAATSCIIDSRQVVAESIFAAFVGENVDGHAYIEVAASKGATILLVTRTDIDYEKLADSCCTILVADILAALQALATDQRQQMTCPVIGITGSSGKTSTKDLLYSALVAAMPQSGAVVATTGNYNNELGVPLTLLKANEQTQAVIVEMGMRGLGQITELTDIAHPTMAIITTIGDAHIEMLGSRENIAKAKGEIFQALDSNQLAFMPANIDFADYLESVSKAPIIKTLVEASDVETVATVADATNATTAADEDKLSVSNIDQTPSSASIIALVLDYDEMGRAEVLIDLPGEHEKLPMKLQIPGLHSVSNALLALAVTQYLGIDPRVAIAGLEAAQPADMRMQRCKVTALPSIEDARILVDCYNANPESTAASLKTLSVTQLGKVARNSSGLGKRIAVLGDMLEMGQHSPRVHKDILLLAGLLNIDLVFVYGQAYTAATQDVLSELSTGRNLKDIPEIRAYTNIDLLTDNLLRVLTSGSIVLIKGSRGMHMERIVDALSPSPNSSSQSSQHSGEDAQSKTQTNEKTAADAVIVEKEER